MLTNIKPYTDNTKQIVVSSSKSIRFIRQHEITYVKADNCYSLINLIDNSSFMTSITLKKYEVELDRRFFFRCHKSFIINIQYVKEITRNGNDYIILSQGTKIPISKRKLPVFKKLMIRINVY